MTTTMNTAARTAYEAIVSNGSPCSEQAGSIPRRHSLLDGMGGATIELIAPAGQAVSTAFRNVRFDSSARRAKGSEAQLFFARVYGDEGLLPEQVRQSLSRLDQFKYDHVWQLVLRDAEGRITGIMGCQIHGADAPWSDTQVSGVVDRMPHGQQDKYKYALKAFIAETRAAALAYAETGAWAVNADHRHGRVGPVLVLTSFALYAVLGHARVTAFANAGNAASKILKRMGGSPLSLDGAPMPLFHDPFYDREVEIVTFDSRIPADRYRESIHELASILRQAPVMADSIQFLRKAG